MSRFTMTLAAAAASAVAAVAVVALPAVGADSKTPRKQATPDDGFVAFVSCLHSHGLADAPSDPAQLKPWLASRETSDPDAVKAAMAACDDKRPDGGPGAGEKRVVVQGPDVRDLIACVRSHGLDAPTAPDAFKRWIGEKDASDPGALARVMGACKMALDPGPPKGAGKPGTCDSAAQPPADETAKPEPPANDAAKPGI